MADSSGSGRRPPQRGPRTLRDLQNDGGSSHGHAHDDSDDESDQDYYAGGEKSGLAVQGDPQEQINSILDRARR
jgi:UBX domain-containing protein 1